MKKQITTIVATLSLIVTLTALGIAAGSGIALTANIPFDFTVNGKTLPAGQYNVTTGSAQGTLMVRNADTREAAVVIVNNASTDQDGKAMLKFHRYGAQRFLASVSDGNNASEIPVTKAERKARSGDHLAIELKPEIETVSATIGQ